MSILTSIKSLFSKPIPVVDNTPVLEVILPPKGWRTGMWVVDNGNVGILCSIGSVCEVHYVDTVSGETIYSEGRPLGSLRQCKYIEIPECRRGLTQEQAEVLGYGS